MMKKYWARAGACILLMSTLVACSGGDNSVYGVYAFQLGTAKSSNVGMSLTLLDEVCSDDPNSNKSFKLEIHNSSAVVTSSSSSETSSETPSTLYNPNIIYDRDVSCDNVGLIDFGDINYQLSENSMSDLAISFSGSFVVSQHNGTNVLSFNVYTVEQDAKISIPAEYISYILTATISGSTVTITVPVSVPDLLKQVKWKSEHKDDPTSVPDPTSEDRYHTVSFPLIKD